MAEVAEPRRPAAPAYPPRREPVPSEPTRPVRGPSPASAIGIYVIVLIVLQIFLLTVALDAYHDDKAGLAWVAAATSVFLTLSTIVIHRVFGER